MARIEELPETLANQIAAGEVIERPASVVKELVENAIDAGSTQIDITIEEAGLKMIQVTDNGEGIDPEDVKNAFKRHATSKIYSREDLFRIRTLGFRGEALPSIASVSEVTMETSTGGQQGTFLQLKAGQIVDQKSNEARKGTKIKVENLFFNTPARLKYVKTIQTELSNVTDIVNRLAISHPEIAFRMANDQNPLIKTPGNDDLRQTLAGIYGVTTAKKMRKIEKADLDFGISGYISLPEVTRASRNYLSIMINGRYIKNYLLNKAIVAGYRSKLMVGRFPIAVIEIKMDPLLVDVNVHPTKQEVRISKEKELMALIEAAIHDCLSAEQLIPEGLENLSFKKSSGKSAAKPEQTTIDFGGQPNENRKADALSEDSFRSKPSRYPAQRSVTPFERGIAYDAQDGQFYINEKNQQSPKPASDSEKNDPSSENNQIEAGEIQSDLLNLHQLPHMRTAEKVLNTEAELEDSPAGFPLLEYVGQMHGTYLFAQNEEGLYIIDQHAAQERIKYEYFRQKIGEVSSDQQDLLVPIMLDYPKNDAIKISENTAALEEVGIFLEPFGQSSFLLRSHPIWFDNGEEEAIVREMVELLLEQGKVEVAKFREASAIMMSCKGSIKANHYLNDREARSLLTDLGKTKNPYNCPHGRPVLIHFDNHDMQKMFKRIQDPH